MARFAKITVISGHIWRIYQIDAEQRSKSDRSFLESIFHRFLLNFIWWVNKKDAEGRNVFPGGLLGLDNISVFDRSAPLPVGSPQNPKACSLTAAQTGGGRYDFQSTVFIIIMEAVRAQSSFSLTYGPAIGQNNIRSNIVE